MALKNLFDMVKADRYTQDGREELIKAQEAETEDKVYQIGEISQKTGLQKTANGWVKPKSGKQPGAATKHDTDPQTYIVKKNDELRKMYQNEKDPAKKAAMKKALQKQASMMEPEPFSSTESKSAPKSLAGTPMKKADLNSRDPYEITHSMKPDTASEAKEMDKISAFMQEETGATLRNAITARESFYKNTKNPSPEQQEGLAALMKIQQKLGYGKPAEGPALNGQKKTVSHQEYRDGPMYGPAGSKPQPVSSINKEKLLDSLSFDLVDTTSDIEEEYNAVEHSDNSRLPEFVRQQVEKEYVNKTNGEKWSDAEKDIIAEEVTKRIKERQSNDSAPRILTGDTRIRVRK